MNVDIELDTEPREVSVPPDFAEALARDVHARRFFDRLSYSNKRRLMAGEAASLAVGDLIYPSIVSPSALLIAVVLAVFKPWSRIRKRRTPQRDPR